MSEQRLSLLIAGGGILCLLIQLVVSLTDNPGRRAQQEIQKVAAESVQRRAEKRASRLTARLAPALAEGNSKQMQADLEMTVQSDPDLVELGLVDKDKDLTLISSSDPGQVGRPLSSSLERWVRDSMNAQQNGQNSRRIVEPLPQQRFLVV